MESLINKQRRLHEVPAPEVPRQSPKYRATTTTKTTTAAAVNRKTETPEAETKILPAAGEATKSHRYESSLHQIEAARRADKIPARCSKK